MSQSFYRGLLVLGMIPRETKSVTSHQILNRLRDDYGIRVSLKTVQNDLASITSVYPLQQIKDGNSTVYCWPTNMPVELLPGHDDYTALSWHLLEQYVSPLLPKTMASKLQPVFDTASRYLENRGPAQARAWLQRVHMIPRAFRLIPPEINEEVQKAVYEALWLGDALQVIYQSRGRNLAQELTLHPQSLVIREGVIYLVAKVNGYDDLRHFALHRMLHAESAYRDAEFLDDETIESYLNSGAFSYPEGGQIKLVLRTDAETGQHLLESPLDADQRHRALDDGRIEIEANVMNSQQLRWWIQGFGSSMEVVEPQALRDQLTEQAQKMMSLYCSD